MKRKKWKKICKRLKTARIVYDAAEKQLRKESLRFEKAFHKWYSKPH